MGKPSNLKRIEEIANSYKIDVIAAKIIYEKEEEINLILKNKIDALDSAKQILDSLEIGINRLTEERDTYKAAYEKAWTLIIKLWRKKRSDKKILGKWLKN